MASGQVGAEVNQSSVRVDWRDFPPGIIWRNAWAKGRFRAAHRLAESHPLAAAVPPPVNQCLRMAEMKEKFATHKKVKTLAARGLHKGEWDQVPLLHDKITEDGRTPLAIRDAMTLESRV